MALSELSPATGAEDVAEQQSSESEKETVEAESSMGVPVGGAWLVSTSRGTSCLHILGGCHRIPGIHYGSWKVVSKGVGAEQYRKSCKTCFPRGFPLLQESAQVAVEADMEEGMPNELFGDEGSVSSSSDSSE